MSAFTGPLTITHLDLDWRLWRLEAPLVYEVGELGSGRRITVPAGFETDGTSVPRFFWAVLPTWGKYSRAAVIHDFLGTLLVNGTPHPEGQTQAVIDAVFYEAMTVCEVRWPIKVLMWSTVRIVAKLRGLK